MKTQYETVIGLEVHSQLLTKSKMFCQCGADYQKAPPNSRVCPICMGMPGVLPVVNKNAVRLIIRTGLSLGCKISETTKFDRKNYSYPDLMKGYQISQFDLPVAYNGIIEITEENKQTKQIGITRVHLEEDVAKLIHKSNGSKHSLVDINRAGVPLMEIVSEPDMRSPEEANIYLNNLHAIVRSIKSSTANMEEGSFRCDANISIRVKGDTKLGTKVEIKNVNSFRSVFKALKFEERRQIRCIETGEPIIQETRGWSDENGQTFSQRIKEYAADYRYFPEPDIPPILISRKWVEEIRSEIPELPKEKITRYMEQFKLSQYDSQLLVSNYEISILFEQALISCVKLKLSVTNVAKRVANLLIVELPRLIHEFDIADNHFKSGPTELAQLILLIETGKLSTTMAKTVFEKMFVSGKTPDDVFNASEIAQINDEKSLGKIITQVINKNPGAVADYKNGKDTAIKFLIGQIMKISKGTANPKMASELLVDQLNK
jgi:aspartyl-tRNA(Asn)/glutamyl-tRNA(Gln) amidotransferase subunit B